MFPLAIEMAVLADLRDAPHSEVGAATISAMLECALTTPLGPIVEVGVFKGGTAWHLARLAQQRGVQCWLYDTFTGMPYCGPLDSHKLGDFSGTSVEAVRQAIPYAHVIQGLYPASAADNEPIEPIAFVHLDCDQEESYRSAIWHLQSRMAKDGVMWFDDAPDLPGAREAVIQSFDRGRLNKTHGKWWVRF